MKSVVKILSDKGIVVNYINVNENHNGFERLHRTRFKQIVYGEIFTYYHKDMDFSKSNILEDNRKQTKDFFTNENIK